MPGNIYIPPQRNNNPIVNMGMNMLSQMAMAQMAGKMRAEEAAKQREAEAEEHDRRMDTQLALHGYGVLPEGAAVPPGSIKIGDKYYQKQEVKPKLYELGGKKFIGMGDKLIPFDEKAEKQKYQVGEIQQFDEGDKKITGVYTGNENDSISGLTGWKRTGIEGNRYRPEGAKVDVHLPAMENEATKEFGKKIGELASKRLVSAEEARSQNLKLDVVKREIEKGARTGFGEETLLNIRSAAQTFGIDNKDLSGQEIIRQTSNEMALRLRNPESGLGLTGNTSNKDLDFLKESVVGLQRTERGNLKMIDVMQKFNKLKIDTAREQQRIIKENKGVVPNDLDERLMKFVDNYKVFDDKERNDIKKLSMKTINTGVHKATGKKTIQLEDGTWEYAD